MPAYRNNYGARSRVVPFSGRGHILSARPSTWTTRAYNIGRSALPYVAPLVKAAIKRSISAATTSTTSSAAKRRRMDNVEPMGISGPGSQHNFVFPGRGLQISKYMSSPQVFVENSYSSVSCSTGLQEYAVVGSLYSAAALQAIQQFAGSGTFTRELNIYHQFVDCAIQIANSTDQSLYVTIYQIVPKRDSSDANLVDPATTVQNSLAIETTSGVAGTATDYRTIGFTPQAIEPFNQYWKIVGQQDLLMESGQVHLERVRFAVNRKVDSALTLYQNVLKDFNRFVMIRISGTPEWATATPTTVSTTPGRVSVVTSYNYHYRKVETAPVTYQLGNALPTSVTNPLFEEHYDGGAQAPTS